MSMPGARAYVFLTESLAAFYPQYLQDKDKCGL